MAPTNKSIEILQTQVDETKIALDAIKAETDETLKQEKAKEAAEKLKFTKEDINKKLEELKALGEATHKVEIEKLEAMLLSIEGFDNEILGLQNKIIKDINTPAPADNTKIELPKEDVPKSADQRGWFERQWNGVTSKEEWKNNRGTNIVRVLGGIGAVSLAVRGIRKFFGLGKKKEEKKEGDKKEGMSTFKKILLRGGGILGGVMIWKNWGKISDRFSNLFGTKTPDDTTDKDYNDLTNIDQMDKDFEKSPKMADYNIFGDKVNEFYTNIYGDGGMEGPDLLGEKDVNGKQLEKHSGTIPFILDEMYSDVGGILSERAFFSEENTSKEGQVTKYFMDKCSGFLGTILKPFVGTLSWLTEDMFNFDANGRLELNQKGKDALEKNKGEDTETIFKNVFRKFTKVRVYLNDKENQLRYLYTKKKLESLGEIKAGMPAEDIDEYVDEKVHDNDFQEKNIDDLIKTDFYDKKIISETGNQSIFDTLKNNNILDGKLGDDVQKEIDDVEKRKKGIVGDALDRLVSGNEDVNSASNKEELSEICSDMKDEIQSDFVKRGIMTRNLGIFANLFNTDDVAKEQLEKLFGYKEITDVYIQQITEFEKKLSGSITKQDVQTFRSTVDQFFMFEKEIMSGVGMMVDVKEKNGSMVVRLQTMSGGMINRFMNLSAGGKIITVSAIAFGLGTKRGRKLLWKTTKIVGGVVLYPVAKLTGKSVDAMGRVLRRGFGKAPILKELNRYRFKGDNGPEQLKQALRNREITLEQATQIATRRSTKGLFKDRNKVNKRMNSAGTDPIIAKKMLLKEIVDPGSVTFTRAEDLELIGKYFDESPWDEFFLANQEATKREAFKMLQSYDKKIIDLKKLGKTSRIEFMRKCLTKNGFYDFENIKKLINNIDTIDIDGLHPEELNKLASKLGKNIKNLSDTQAINDFIKEVKNAKNVINDLSAEQKVVAKMIGDDVDELKKFIAGDLRKQPGGGPNEILGLHYEKQLEKLEKFQKEIKAFSPDELSAFKNLHALEFKSHHIVELLDLKKTNKSVASALENMEKKAGNIEDLLNILKSEKKAARTGEEISESLIKTVEKLHITNALKSTDEIADFIKAIFKFISRVT